MLPLARHCAAATTAAALFGAMPLLVAAPAQAAPAPDPAESGKEIVFSGNRHLLGVSCTTNPSVSSVTIPAETTLRVVNKTGYWAKLFLDGASQGEIADRAVARVLFHRGPVTLGLKPSCVLSEESAVRVEVVAGLPTRGAQPPAGSGHDQPSATPTRSGAGGDGGDRDKSVATVDDTSGAGDQGVAAEALSSVRPARETGPVGPLALIATVCVVGVTAGAIRAIIAQRASRTGVA